MIHTVPTEIQRWHKTAFHYSKFWAIKVKQSEATVQHPVNVCLQQAIHRYHINLSFPQISLKSLKVAPMFDVLMLIFFAMLQMKVDQQRRQPISFLHAKSPQHNQVKLWPHTTQLHRFKLGRGGRDKWKVISRRLNLK